MRPRRILLILGLCWLVFSTAAVAYRWRAVTLLEERQAPGIVTFVWEEPAWVSPKWGKWRKLLPMVRVAEVQVYLPLGDGQPLARAVRTCGPIKDLKLTATARISPGSTAGARAFLLGLGHQPDLRSLSLQNVPLAHNEMATLLQRIPQLQSLHLYTVDGYTGADFPLFASLQTVSISNTPFSDDGLAALLRCPALKSCSLFETAVTPAAVLQIPNRKQLALSSFVYMNRDMHIDDFLKLRAMSRNTDIYVRAYRDKDELGLGNLSNLRGIGIGQGIGLTKSPGATPPSLLGRPIAIDGTTLLLGGCGIILAIAWLAHHIFWRRKEAPKE